MEAVIQWLSRDTNWVSCLEPKFHRQWKLWQSRSKESKWSSEQWPAPRRPNLYTLCNEEANEISLSPEISCFPFSLMHSTTVSRVCIFLPGRSFFLFLVHMVNGYSHPWRQILYLTLAFLFLHDYQDRNAESSHWTEWKNATPKENRE